MWYAAPCVRTTRDLSASRGPFSGQKRPNPAPGLSPGRVDVPLPSSDRAQSRQAVLPARPAGAAGGPVKVKEIKALVPGAEAEDFDDLEAWDDHKM